MPYRITSRIVFHFYLPRFPLETIALIYLDDSSARHSSNTLRDDVEDRLKNAHVAGDEEAQGNGGINVAPTDMSEGLKIEKTTES